MQSQINDISIDSYIYPRKAVAATQGAFKPFCRVKATPQKNGMVSLTFTLNNSCSENLENVVLEFMNYLLDITVSSYIDI